MVAAFLVSRGPHSYLGAQTDIINAGDWSDPLFRLHRLDTGKPTGDCTEEKPVGVSNCVVSRGQKEMMALI